MTGAFAVQLILVSLSVDCRFIHHRMDSINYYYSCKRFVNPLKKGTKLQSGRDIHMYAKIKICTLKGLTWGVGTVYKGMSIYIRVEMKY